MLNADMTNVLLVLCVLTCLYLPSYLDTLVSDLGVCELMCGYNVWWIERDRCEEWMYLLVLWISNVLTCYHTSTDYSVCFNINVSLYWMGGAFSLFLDIDRRIIIEEDRVDMFLKWESNFFFNSYVLLPEWLHLKHVLWNEP